MFVKSNMSVEVVYNTNGHAIVLKPKAITYIADDLVTPQELISCYGSRIAIMSPKLVEQIIKEEATKCLVEPTKEPEAAEPTKVPEVKEPEGTISTEDTTTVTVGEATTTTVDETTTTVTETKTQPVEKPATKQAKKSTGKKTNKKSK